MANVLKWNQSTNSFSVSGATSVTPVVGEGIDNNFSVAQTFGAGILQTGAAGTGNQSPLLNVGDAFSDFVADGMQWAIPSSASLTTTMSSGSAYLNSVRTLVPAVSGNAFPASSDTYVSVNNSGLIDYQSVANGAAAPTPASGYVQTAKVVTSPIQSPTATLSTSTSGSLASGTYGIALVAFDATGYGAVGASGTVAVTSAQSGSGSIEISWVNPLNETSMDVYATTAGSTTLGLVASGVTGTTYTYTGSVAPGVAAPTVATSNAIQQSLILAPRITFSNLLSMESFGCIGDAKEFTAIASISSGSTNITTSLAIFSVDDIGKTLAISGAGDNGRPLNSIIISFSSPTSVSIQTPATNTVSGVNLCFGTDNSIQLQNALDYLEIHNGGALNNSSNDKISFLFTKQVIIPQNCSLVGHDVFGVSPGSMTTFMISDETTPLWGATFEVATGARIKNILLNQPMQNAYDTTPIEYPWAIGPHVLSTSGNNDCSFEKIVIYNLYNGINYNYLSRSYTNIIFGQPLNIGLQYSNQYDTSRFFNVHLWPFFTGTDTPMWDYVSNNADSFVFGFGNTVGVSSFSFGYKKGFAFKNIGGTPDVTLIGCGTDTCMAGYFVESLGTCSLIGCGSNIASEQFQSITTVPNSSINNGQMIVEGFTQTGYASNGPYISSTDGTFIFSDMSLPGIQNKYGIINAENGAKVISDQSTMDYATVLGSQNTLIDGIRCGYKSSSVAFTTNPNLSTSWSIFTNSNLAAITSISGGVGLNIENSGDNQYNVALPGAISPGFYVLEFTISAPSGATAALQMALYNNNPGNNIRILFSGNQIVSNYDWLTDNGTNTIKVSVPFFQDESFPSLGLFVQGTSNISGSSFVLSVTNINLYNSSPNDLTNDTAQFLTGGKFSQTPGNTDGSQVLIPYIPRSSSVFSGASISASGILSLIPTNQIYLAVSSTTTSGSITTTASQLAGGYLADGATQTAAFTVTTDTAANILAAMPNAVVGTAFKWRFINNDQSATGYAGTLAGGTGVTVGTVLPNPAVPKGGYEDYVFTFTAVGATPTLTVEAVGGSSAALL